MRRLLLLPLLCACWSKTEPAVKTDPRWMAKVKPWYCATEPLIAPTLIPSAPRPPAPATPAQTAATPAGATPAAATPAPAATPAGATPAAATPAAATPAAATPAPAATPIPGPTPAAPATPEPTSRSVAFKLAGSDTNLTGLYAIYGGSRDRLIGKLTGFERGGPRIAKLKWETDKRQKGDVTLTFSEDFASVTAAWTGGPAGVPVSTTFTAAEAGTCAASSLIR